eukprot:XP_017168443.1 PREDICTED: RING finger protein 166 isoform X2 [Mus musculus]
MRAHISSCLKVQEQMANCPKFVPVVPTSQPIPSNIPNRSTFACPYCGARNLDQQELVKHCVESHRSDPNRVVSSGGIGLLPEGDAGTGLLSGMGHLKWRVLCMPYYEWVGGRAGRKGPLPATPNFFSRYAPSAQQCPGGTPATKAPTSCSICCTGTSSPTTPSWTTASTKKLPSRLPWLCPSLRTEAQPGHPPLMGQKTHSRFKG